MGEEGERMRTLKLGFKEAVSKTAQIVEDPQKLKRFLKDNPELCNKAVELARSLRENADVCICHITYQLYSWPHVNPMKAKFKELCQKYDVEAQLNKLDELLSMPWNEHLHKGDDESVDACNPSALDTDRYIVDVHKVIEENIKSDLIFEQYQQLQKELESVCIIVITYP